MAKVGRAVSVITDGFGEFGENLQLTLERR